MKAIAQVHSALSLCTGHQTKTIREQSPSTEPIKLAVESIRYGRTQLVKPLLFFAVFVPTPDLSRCQSSASDGYLCAGRCKANRRAGSVARNVAPANPEYCYALNSTIRPYPFICSLNHACMTSALGWQGNTHHKTRKGAYTKTRGPQYAHSAQKQLNITHAYWCSQIRWAFACQCFCVELQAKATKETYTATC